MSAAPHLIVHLPSLHGLLGRYILVVCVLRFVSFLHAFCFVQRTESLHKSLASRRSFFQLLIRSVTLVYFLLQRNSHFFIFEKAFGLCSFTFVFKTV